MVPFKCYVNYENLFLTTSLDVEEYELNCYWVQFDDFFGTKDH
jgi:hypothetical protein